MARNVRLVLFDAMHTLIRPTATPGETYAAAFARFELGHFDSARVQVAFTSALDRFKREQPLLRQSDTAQWWKNVIQRTAADSGASSDRVTEVLPELYESLIVAYQQTQAYRAYDDVGPTLQQLHEAGVKMGVVTNTDSRIRDVLRTLDIEKFLDTVIVSEEEGVEKPMSEIWTRALNRVGVSAEAAVHVGDDAERDFAGARRAGLHALLLRRGTPQTTSGDEVNDLHGVLQWLNVPSKDKVKG